MIALVVADTSHTRVMRLPGVVWCGTRVHTIPDALATSIAATRSTICSCSSTSTCLPSGTTRAPCPEGWGCGCPGARLGTETLIGVLEATVRDPPDRPRRQTVLRPQRPSRHPASAGNQPDFHACTASPQGYKNCLVNSRLGVPVPAPAAASPPGPLLFGTPVVNRSSLDRRHAGLGGRYLLAAGHV